MKRFKGIGFLLLIPLFSGVAAASGYEFFPGESYWSRVKYTGTEKVLYFRAVRRLEYYNKAPSPTDQKRMCTFDDSGKGDCGFIPMSLGIYDEFFSYAFLLKTEGKDGFELYSDAEKQHTFFVTKAFLGEPSDPPREFKVQSVPEWIASGNKIISIQGNARVYGNKNGAGKTLADCASTSYKFGKSGEVGDFDIFGLNRPLESKEPVKCDESWIKLECLSAKCLGALDFNSKPKKKGGKKQCPLGWVRWRSEAGKLLLRPDHENLD